MISFYRRSFFYSLFFDIFFQLFIIYLFIHNISVAISFALNKKVKSFNFLKKSLTPEGPRALYANVSQIWPQTTPLSILYFVKWKSYDQPHSQSEKNERSKS